MNVIICPQNSSDWAHSGDEKIVFLIVLQCYLGKTHPASLLCFRGGVAESFSTDPRPDLCVWVFFFFFLPSSHSWIHMQTNTRSLWQAFTGLCSLGLHFKTCSSRDRPLAFWISTQHRLSHSFVPPSSAFFIFEGFSLNRMQKLDLTNKNHDSLTAVFIFEKWKVDRFWTKSMLILKSTFQNW